MKDISVNMSDSELVRIGQAMERKGVSDMDDFTKQALLNYAEEILSADK